MEKIDAKQRLYDYHKHGPRTEVNFILSHADTIACFCYGSEEYHGIIAVTDTSYNPVFIHETNAYVNSCGISDDGEYAIFRTANSPNSDGNTTFFINISDNSILWKKILETSFKGIQCHHIDTERKIICEIHDTYEAIFGFDGELLDASPKFTIKQLFEDYSHYPPYWLIDIALLLIICLEKNGPDESKLTAITECIELAVESDRLSYSSIASAYKSLGKYYESISDKSSALECYKRGIEYNPKLGVKKRVNHLESILREDV